MFKNLAIAALVVATATILAPTTGRAQELQYMQNGGMCKSALPAFDGNLRTRPLAIANEGTKNAFITCSMLDRLTNTNARMSVYLHNRGAAAVNISCTLVTGSGVNNPKYFPKTRTYAAGAGAFILWETSDNGGMNFGKQANFSCNLPPRTELQLVTVLAITNL